ncbi:sensor histidine kinase [Actinoplanes sp. TRM 88003]|uniref:histidine kinase n=1 Tax=Paractinoplanes aksuensis TaxID=2939490 RepID=A0ABT1DZU6_9ACTN|nr:sensor histidine kinase [Actinoplanes aksuensis]MCO8275425.1 sensor histidine kinase [Actinoplanes aksuensis]
MRLRPTDLALTGGFVLFAVTEEYLIAMPGGWWPLVLVLSAATVLLRRFVPLLAMAPHVIEPMSLFYRPAVVAGEQTVNFRLWQLVGTMIVIYTVGRHVPPTGLERRGLIGAGLVATTFVVYLANDPGDPMAALFFPIAPYVLGVTLSVQARRSAAVREQQARESVMEERVRIARELHDMVAHSVTVMVVQAGAVRRRLDAGLPVDSELLRGIESSGREAVGELRRTLGLLRGEGADTALAPVGLDRLDELVTQVREAGLTVTLHQQKRPVPPAIDVSAYRIVQEALTNVLRHAGPVKVEVTVGFTDGGLRLEVVNDGRPVVVGTGGQGLIGMRERATLFGGELTAEPRREGGFAVRAQLPLPAAALR